MDSRLKDPITRMKELNFLLENQHQINTSLGWGGTPKTVDEEEVDEISKGLATRAYNKIVDKHNERGYYADENPLQFTKDLQQSDRFAKYINPSIAAELKKLGFEIVSTTHNEILLDFYVDQAVSVPGKPDVRIAVYPESYKIVQGNPIHLGEPRQRAMLRLVKKMQLDMVVNEMNEVAKKLGIKSFLKEN